MEGVWFGIMHSLNLIIPRPDDETHKDSVTKPTNPGGPPSSAHNNVSPPPASSPRASSSESKFNKFKQFFQRESELSEEESPASDLNTSILIKERNLLYPLLQLKDYGRPAYQHLSRGSWELILTSRCFLEEIVKALALEVSIVSYLPTPDESEDLLLTTHTQTTSSPPRPWGLDPLIPISSSTKPTSSPPLPTKRRPLPDSVPPLSTTDSPKMKPPPPSHEMRTIQQRLDARTSLPYRSTDDHRIRKQR
jgi:hypothetical protein